MHSQPSNMGIYCAKMGIEPSNLGVEPPESGVFLANMSGIIKNREMNSMNLESICINLNITFEVMVHFFNLGIDYH